jgi:pimeloyl-ACP methyl ester carboxylesterase
MDRSRHNEGVKRNQMSTAPTLLLVHGAWLDGSSWREVIALLQREGWDCIAVQIPLTSLTADVAAVIRAAERQSNEVVLVGHGYAGSVISQAGAHAKVQGLIFVAAIVPDAGETTRELLHSLPNSAYPKLLKPDTQGLIYLPREAFVNYLAHDLPHTESHVLSAMQIPLHERTLNDRLTVSASRSKPRFYIRTEKDRMIAPEAQQQFIDCIGAESVSLAAGHVPFLSEPSPLTASIVQGVRFIEPRASGRRGR